MNIGDIFVQERQVAFMRGEMSDSEVELIKKKFPTVMKVWLRTKLDLKRQLNKFRQELKVVSSAVVSKAIRNRRFTRKGKRNQYKQHDDLKVRYNKSNCTILISWTDFCRELEITTHGV